MVSWLDRSLLNLRILDHNYAPLRIGDELALPIHEDASFNKLEFDFRLEKMDVEPAPPAIDPHSRLNSIESMTESNEQLYQSIPRNGNDLMI